MRRVELSVPDRQREVVTGVLREWDLEHTLTEEAGAREGRSVVTFVVPADAVEHILQELHDAGVDEEEFTVSLATEFAIFEHVDEVQNRWEDTPNKIAPRTLRSKSKDLRLNNRSYVWMMFLSTVVATAGLLLGSPAIVVGSMVLAPIVSPMLTASVGAVRNDRNMLVDSVHQQAYGLGVAVVGAILLALVIRQLQVVPPTLDVTNVDLVALRISPSILGLVVGLAAGAAGAFGLATKGQVSLVGVMIAGALIPTAAAVGIGVAWGQFVVAAGALVLLVVTIVAINVGGFAMLWYLGYRPDQVDESLLALHTTRQVFVVGGTALLVVTAVLASGTGFYQQSTFEQTVNDAVSDALDQEQYRLVGLREVTIEYTATGPLAGGPVEVSLTVSRPTGESYPDLPDAVDRRITERTGREVLVEVEWIDYRRSRAAGAEVGRDRTAVVPPGATAPP